MKHRLGWIGVGLAVLALGFWGLGYLEGKHAADEWYREHPITVWVRDSQIQERIKVNCVAGCADVDDDLTRNIPSLRKKKP